VAETLKIIIQGQDKATKDLKNVNSELAKMEGLAGDTDVQLTRLQKAAILLAGAAGIGRILVAVGKAAWDLAKLGAQAQRLETSFARLADTQAPEMLEGLREASRGAISDMALMQAANQAMMLGVTKDAKQLAQLMEVAIDRGRAMGLSAEQAFSDLVRGIGRMSPLILDNLGIVMDAEKTFGAYAASIGKTAAELDSAEKRQALLNRVLQESVSIGDDAAVGYEQQEAAIANLKVEIGLYLEEVARIPAVIADVARQLTEQISATRAAINIMEPYNVILKEQFEYLHLGEQEAQRRITGLRSIEAALRKGIITEEEAIVSAQKLLGVSRDWRTELQNMEPDLAAGSAHHRDLARAIDEVASAWRSIEMPSTEDLNRFADAQWRYAMSIHDTAGQIRLLEDRQREVKKSQAEWWDLEREIDALRKKLAAEAETGTEKHLTKMNRIYEQGLSELRSAVEGLLQPTGVTELDMARTRLGTYTDQWDEYIRRVRSAATDAQSVWKYLIPTDILAQGADAIKVWAAETEEAFYAGLVPAEINWEAFQRDYEAFLTKKAGREAMIEEAMARVGGVRVDMEAFLGLAPDLAENTALASGAMKEIGDTSVPIGNLADSLPDFTQGVADATLGVGAFQGGLSDALGNVADDFGSLEEKTGDLIGMFERLRGEVEQHLPPPGEKTDGKGGKTDGTGGGTDQDNGDFSLQAGTPFWHGGGAWVGERGPEYVNLPAGSRVHNARESRGMGGDTYNIVINAGGVPAYEIEGAARRGILSARRARGLR